MQQLKVFQSYWAMELRSPDRPERSADERFRMVAEAGYDGMCIDPSVSEIPDFIKLRPLYENYGLDCMVNAFPFEIGDMQSLYGLAGDLGAKLVNIIGGVMPIRPEDSVPVIHQWMREADATGLPVLFETHRDSLLNDLYYTLQVMDLVPEMRLCADLSHFVIDREMRAPIRERDQAWVDRVL
ncbi:MAG: sugar phosphate isomerase/epimerase, partial [Gammaproteobacteria bacterium]|nr:sugar phosphate isomerase/epimerase [Gammaproteobacteria bacterium]